MADTLRRVSLFTLAEWDGATACGAKRPDIQMFASGGKPDTCERWAPTDEQIRELPYRLWSEAGEPEDREQEFWHIAERQLHTLAAANSADATG
jgi:hypothetical protein